MTTPRILVCGGRDFKDYRLLTTTLNRIVQERGWLHDQEYMMPDVVIISGVAKGADTLAIDWAVVNFCPVATFQAYWKKYPRSAGVIRNQQMLDEGKPDLVVAFPGGRGTADMIRRAKKARVEVMEVQYDV